MQRTLRIVMSLVLAWTMTINPTVACNCGGGGGGGGYYSGYSPSYSSYSGYSYASYYPTGGYYASYECGGCGSCGWSDCGSCSGCSSCGWSDCGGCSTCGGGCSDCGGCSGCSSDATVTEGTPMMGEPTMSQPTESMPAPSNPTRMAPAPPAHTSTPSTVNKQPSLPPQSSEPRIDTQHSRVETLPMEKSQALPPQTPDTFSTPSPAMKEPATNDNDLFSKPPEEKAAAPSGDLFSPAESSPALTPPQKPADSDLFAPPAEAPAESTPAKPADDDLFKNTKNILTVPGGLASGAMRRWVDNTGDYSCRGRLLRVMDGKVQILKETGRTTTVSMDRLSQNDLEFVNLQASALKADSMSKTAQLSH